jgi:hypothetical protein
MFINPSSMKKLVFLLLIFLTLNSCNTNHKNQINPIDLIPENTSLVLKIESPETFKSDIKNNTFIKALSGTGLHRDMFRPIEILDLLNTDSQVLICYDKNDEATDYTLLTRYHDSLLKNMEENATQVFSKLVDSVYVVSSSKDFLDRIIPDTKASFESVFLPATDRSSFSIYLNENSMRRLGQAMIGDEIYPLTDWVTMDMELAPDQIAFSGVAMSNDTLPQLLKIFKNTIPQENTIQNIVPSGSEGFLSLTYDDFDVLHRNLSTYRRTVLDSLGNYDLFHTINEVGEIYVEDAAVVALRSIDPFATREALQDYQNPVTNYRNVTLYEFSDPSIFRSVFFPFISNDSIWGYTVLEDYFVFGSSEADLQHIISNYQNGSTMANQSAFKNNRELLSDESSLLLVANAKRLKQLLASISGEEGSNLNLETYKNSAIQWVQDDDIVHINGVVKKHRSRTQRDVITEEFNLVLEADIMMSPQFVTNHRTKQKDIVVQDVQNNLYLISNTGKIRWKKRLHGPVMGRIEQIDIYRNGRLQLAFATPNRVYVIDRLGRDVAPFPARFNDEITQPLSVFDYDNNRKYRLLVTQGRELLMYDVNAAIVRGFTFRSASDNIIHQPQHFRIGRKDYIVIKTENKIHILDRTGKNRVTPKTQSTYSREAVYVYRNKFTTTTKSGALITIDTNGNTGIQDLNLTDQHHIVATSRTLVTLSDNILNIKQKSYELDFGNYQAPKIFYINDKIYITATDLQTQKIYLLDSQARMINNFPVYGNSTMDLANMDNDNRLEFVVKGESNSIIVYKKN